MILTDKEKEVEANLFAMYLLMPNELLKPYLKEYAPGIWTGDPEEIAKAFEVERDWALLRIVLWNKDH